jgi:hypothetical protein
MWQPRRLTILWAHVTVTPLPFTTVHTSTIHVRKKKPVICRGKWGNVMVIRIFIEQMRKYCKHKTNYISGSSITKLWTNMTELLTVSAFPRRRGLLNKTAISYDSTLQYALSLWNEWRTATTLYTCQLPSYLRGTLSILQSRRRIYIKPSLIRLRIIRIEIWKMLFTVEYRL